MICFDLTPNYFVSALELFSRFSKKVLNPFVLKDDLTFVSAWVVEFVPRSEILRFFKISSVLKSLVYYGSGPFVCFGAREEGSQRLSQDGTPSLDGLQGSY